MDLARYDARDARQHLPAILELYADVYGVLPYVNDPFFTVDMYAKRLDGAMQMAGFEVAIASDGDQVIGIGHGVTLPPAIPWWQSLRNSLPPPLVDAADEGRIFWLRELQVREPCRNKGIGHAIHDFLCAGRSEGHAVLTVIIDNEPPRSAYLRWGYQIVGRIRHAPESPLYDAMARPLGSD
ncbi:GNAT family N-acetyltransferase [Phytohabitans kaempferiae]|uniref:GNAT family N-acetyltransferase n=1 Tax=Phytohabitans kaempferiae TaxID=1620943 RepID=A0ABV6MBQ2_9ACTN